MQCRINWYILSLNKIHIINLGVFAMKEKKSNLRVYTSCLMIFSFVVFTTSINARELDGVSMPDSVTLSGTDTPLVLNGMGYRTKFVFDSSDVLLHLHHDHW